MTTKKKEKEKGEVEEEEEKEEEGEEEEEKKTRRKRERRRKRRKKKRHCRVLNTLPLIPCCYLGINIKAKVVQLLYQVWEVTAKWHSTQYRFAQNTSSSHSESTLCPSFSPHSIIPSPFSSFLLLSSSHLYQHA